MLSHMLMWLRTFVVKEEEGQTLVEYALIIALIAVVLIIALSFLEGGISNIFNYIGGELNNTPGT